MAQFKTRLLLRFDLLDNWVSANPELLAGEAAVVSIPAGYEHNGVVVTKNPLSLIKVGPGKFNDLQYIGAQAMDVNMYAKDSAKMQEFIDAWIVGKDGYEVGAVLTATADGYKWVKPDTTTVEGLAQALASLEDRVDGIEELLNGSEESEGLIDKVAGIDEVVNGSEEAEGLVDKVEALEEIINGNEDEGIPSLKEDILDEVDEKLDRFEKAFVFVGKDKVEVDEEGNINPVGDYVPQTGDVTFVNSKEYAYDGENWVELGDEGEHASKASVEAVAEDVAALEERIDGIADELGDLASKDKVGKDDLDEELAELVSAHTKVEASEQNGNIKVDEEEVKVYDDSELRDLIGQKSEPAEKELIPVEFTKYNWDMSDVLEPGKEYIIEYVQGRDDEPSPVLVKVPEDFDGTELSPLYNAETGEEIPGSSIDYNWYRGEDPEVYQPIVHLGGEDPESDNYYISSVSEVKESEGQPGSGLAGEVEELEEKVEALEEEIKNPTHTHKIEDLDQEEVVIFFGGNAAGWEE